MPIKEENIENLMNYAITLAESSLIYEEQFKLATLCEDIFLLKENGEIPDKELENNFNTAIKKYFKSNGSFRQEVERFAKAKQLILGI